MPDRVAVHCARVHLAEQRQRGQRGRLERQPAEQRDGDEVPEPELHAAPSISGRRGEAPAGDCPARCSGSSRRDRASADWFTARRASEEDPESDIDLIQRPGARMRCRRRHVHGGHGVAHDPRRSRTVVDHRGRRVVVPGVRLLVLVRVLVVLVVMATVAIAAVAVVVCAAAAKGRPIRNEAAARFFSSRFIAISLRMRRSQPTGDL